MLKRDFNKVAKQINFTEIALRHGFSPVNLLQSNFIEIALWRGCSPVNLLHIFRTAYLRTPLDGCFCN